MSKLFKIIFLLLITGSAMAQIGEPSNLPNPNAPSNYYRIGFMAANKGFIYQERDTFCAKYPTVVKHLDHRFYYTNGNCTRWYGFGGDEIISFTKNTSRDSVILLLRDGRRLAVKDSVGNIIINGDTTLITNILTTIINGDTTLITNIIHGDTTFFTTIINQIIDSLGPDTIRLQFPLYAITPDSIAWRRDSLPKMDYGLPGRDTTLWGNYTIIDKKFANDKYVTSVVKHVGTDSLFYWRNGLEIFIGTVGTAGGGAITLSVIGSTPNANAATLTGTVLNLEIANLSFGGVVSASNTPQFFKGQKSIVVTTDTIFSGYSGVIQRTLLASSGIQRWYVNNGISEVGSIWFSTTNGVPGMSFHNPTFTTRGQIRLYDSTLGGVSIGSLAVAGIPDNQLVVLPNGHTIITGFLGPVVGSATPVIDSNYMLHVLGKVKIRDSLVIGKLSGSGVRMVVANDTGLLSTMAIPSVGTSNLADGIISGGGVVWLHDYVYNVEASVYRIDEVVYSSPSTDITLAAADPALDRIDVFALTTSNTAVAITGTPSSPAVEPDVDANTQFQISFATVTASTTEPPGIVNAWIYQENTEWTTAVSAGTIAAASTSSPYAGTKSVEGTAVANNQNIRFTSVVTPNMGLYQNLTFQIKSKANWAATKKWIIRFYNGTTAIGNPVTFGSSSYGFLSTNTTSYQSIIIPLADFGNISTATVYRITQSNSSGTIGWYLDNVQLQGGQGGGTPQTISLIADVTGSGTNTISTTVTGIRNKTVPTLSAGNLKYNGSAWTFDNTSYQAALSGTGYSKWSGSTPSYLTPTQVTADLNLFTTSLQGLVPPGGTSAKVLHGDGTWKDTTAAGTGTVTNVAALTLGTTGTDLSSSVANSTTTPVITLNVPTASASNRGALSSTDWSTFNSKQATISVTSPITLTGASVGIVNQGTTTQVLHGNASGNASFGQVVNADITNSTIDLTTKVTGLLPIANGGTATATPALVAGTNVTITGTWPNQTINSSASGSSLTRQIITSGSSGTVTGGNYIVTIDPASTLAAYTLTMPASPTDMQTVEVNFGGTLTSGTIVTSLVVSANSGQTILDNTPPLSATADNSLFYRYRTANTTWYRLKL